MKKTIMIIALFTSAVFLAVASSGMETYAKCKGCHGAAGEKAAMGVSPLLKGQSKADIEAKLKGYKAGTYGGAKKAVMAGQAGKLSDDEIASLADYISKF